MGPEGAPEPKRSQNRSRGRSKRRPAIGTYMELYRYLCKTRKGPRRIRGQKEFRKSLGGAQRPIETHFLAYGVIELRIGFEIHF